MKKIRWGILGCGRIARKFATDIRLVADAELVAAGSRSKEAVKAFAAEFPVTYQHSSYEELVANPEVDVIYVASPHGMHYEHTLLCLNHGKAVLCEKAFAINARQAAEMIRVAREKRLFLMEALWTKFTPRFQKMQEMIAAGMLGSMKSVIIQFGFIPAEPAPARLFEPMLGGGTLLDIGIYNVFMAVSVLGRPDDIDARISRMESGVDAQCSIVFTYRNGAMAQLFSSFESNLATEADLCGDRGRIRLATRFYEPQGDIEYYSGRVDSKELIPFDREEGGGFQYQIRHVNQCLWQGLTESPVMSHKDSLLLMETLDTIRKKAGLVFPADQISD